MTFMKGLPLLLLVASLCSHAALQPDREEESVTSLVQMGGVEAIGMARDSRDTSPILARNEAQLHYLKAIESKQLIFATGEAGCGKTWISAAKAAEALIHTGHYSMPRSLRKFIWR